MTYLALESSARGRVRADQLHRRSARSVVNLDKKRFPFLAVVDNKNSKPKQLLPIRLSGFCEILAAGCPTKRTAGISIEMKYYCRTFLSFFGVHHGDGRQTQF
jgi:hypothetical protein